MIASIFEIIFKFLEVSSDFIFNDILRFDVLFNWYVSIFGINKTLIDIFLIGLLLNIYLFKRLDSSDNHD